MVLIKSLELRCIGNGCRIEVVALNKVPWMSQSTRPGLHIGREPHIGQAPGARLTAHRQAHCAHCAPACSAYQGVLRQNNSCWFYPDFTYSSLSIALSFGEVRSWRQHFLCANRHPSSPVDGPSVIRAQRFVGRSWSLSCARWSVAI